MSVGFIINYHFIIHVMVNSDEYLRIFVDPKNDTISMLINCVLMTNHTILKDATMVGFWEKSQKSDQMPYFGQNLVGF